MSRRRSSSFICEELQGDDDVDASKSDDNASFDYNGDYNEEETPADLTAARGRSRSRSFLHEENEDGQV
jgi:hypothetical protein